MVVYGTIQVLLQQPTVLGCIIDFCSLHLWPYVNSFEVSGPQLPQCLPAALDIRPETWQQLLLKEMTVITDICPPLGRLEGQSGILKLNLWGVGRDMRRRRIEEQEKELDEE